MISNGATCTLNTLVADTGETPRTINNWSDLGILRALRSSERRGRGIRRRYPAEPLYGERKYALLASALMKIRLPLVHVKSIVDLMRRKEFIADLQAAHDGVSKVYAIVEVESGDRFTIAIRQGEQTMLDLMRRKATMCVLLNLSKIFTTYKE